ncbi:MAG TPA: PQQ-binding-like beta-propeller repeat protein, partial [Gemmatimonadaceae bacterium]|nr:PQQ-binding-like beta-propeller repeat protein [Gemmatimonadaceae bacterium]
MNATHALASLAAVVAAVGLASVVRSSMSVDRDFPPAAEADTLRSTPVSGGADSAPRAKAPPPTPRTGSANADWTRFGWDAGRSNASTAPTGLTAANLSTLRRQQAAIDGVVDASPIYLKGVRVGGATHDVFFVTTIYGKTLAVDANDGQTLWRYTPPNYDSWAGSRQITNATPVADSSRQFIYAASPDGRVQKLSVSDGSAVWSTPITKLPAREKIASSLNLFRGRVIAVTGGYIGDASPYQGHVAILDGATGRLLSVWNSLCSDRRELMDPSSCSESGSAIWGRAGAVIDSTTGNIYVATGNGRWDGRTNWGDAAIVLDPNAAAILGNYTPTNTDDLEASDRDLGSTSPALLGGGIIAQGGKDRTIRLLDVEQMRGMTPHKGGEKQSVPTPSGANLFTAPAVVSSPKGTWLFAGDGGGTAAWSYGGGQLRPMWKNANAGTSPAFAGGLLYVYDPGGKLRVYEPETGKVVAEL